MKLFRALLPAILVSFAVIANAQNTYTLDAYSSFGSRGDGSIQPGDSIGTNPQSGNNVAISAPFTGGVAYGVQPGDLAGATNGYNMRGIAYDSVSGNLVFVDTHEGQGGSATMVPNSAIYILSASSGQIIGALNTNGMLGGNYTHVVAGVGADGVVYVCNQTTASTTTGFKIYSWPTANTTAPNFSNAPTMCFSNTLTPSDRLGETMDVRGAGTNTQILIGAASSGAGTNAYLFTTADGTNFTSHRLFFPGITNGWFSDGIAFGSGNTFFAKTVGGPLLFLAFDPVAFTGSVIASYSASSQTGSDPLLNIAGICVDTTNHLLAGIEEISGTASGGPGKVWLFDISNVSNQAPAILSSRTYIPNFIKATATMGYLHFAPGSPERLYVNVVNNGMLASQVDSVSITAPTFTLPADYSGGQPKVTDLPSGTRVAVGSTAHFEVFATPDVTNYQWYSNNVPISGANTYFYNVPNAQTNMSGSVFYVTAANAASSTQSVSSTLTVVSSGSYYHPVQIWSVTANSTALSNPTNFITSSGGSSTPNERTMAYNALSNQLIVVRGPASLANLKIFVVNADTGLTQYLLNTSGIVAGGLTLCGCGVADDGAFYAASANTGGLNDASFKVYRWANTGSNTVPVLIFGTNSSAANGSPISDEVSGQYYRFGDALAVHGSGANTEIIVDAQNNTTFAGVLRPVNDGTMTNWTQQGFLLQNVQGSYGFGAYGTGVGRSIQFGPSINTQYGPYPESFWQKRYNAGAATPFVGMGCNASGGVVPPGSTSFTLPLGTNGPMGINFTLNLGAAISFAGTIANNIANIPDTLAYYDLTDPTQPVLLSYQNLPGPFTGGGHMANGNAIGQVVFGDNPNTGTHYIFALDANNGVAAYTLSGGVTPGPKVLEQPLSARVLQGNPVTISVEVDQFATITWYKGTNSPVNTGVTGGSLTFNSAQLTNAGDYFAAITNINGSTNSQSAHLTVEAPGDNFSLTQAWAARTGTNYSYPYVTSTGGANTPNERSFAYNALSNQLLVVYCPAGQHSPAINVVNAATGAELYTMDMTNVLQEGASEVSGSNPLDLDSIAVADDGAVYACCLTPNASGGANGDTNKMFRVYRWADSGPATPSTIVFVGDPSDRPAGIDERWGDALAAHGSGTNTVLAVNSQDGLYAAVLMPTDSTMATFSNYWFYDSSGAGSIGRSLQFGATNTIYEKRKGAPLSLSSYNTNTDSSANLLSINSSSTLGGVFVDTNLNLAAGVDFIGSTTAPLKPDAVALYKISDPTTPMLIKEYNFPTNEVANANFICATVVSGLRVYALDGNNGMAAFYIDPPANQMKLNITSSGSNLDLSWGSTLAVLQKTSSLSPTSWTDVTTVGQTNSVQAAGSQAYYRLIVRR